MVGERGIVSRSCFAEIALRAEPPPMPAAEGDTGSAP
jgi:hypothetical protein